MFVTDEKKVTEPKVPNEPPAPTNPKPEEKEEKETKIEDIENEDEENENAYVEVSKLLGIEVEETLEYESSPEGVANYITEVVSPLIVQQYEDSIQKSNPILYRALQYAKNGGDILELFSTTTDYLNVKLDKENELQIEKIAKDLYKEKGYQDAHIDLIISSEKQKNTLYESTNKLLSEKKQAEEAKSEEKVKQQKQLYEELKNKYLEIKTAYTDIISKGTLTKDINIPKTEKEQLYKYLDEAIDYDNKSKSWALKLPVNKENIKQVVLTTYLVNKKLAEKVVETDKRSEKVNNMFAGKEKKKESTKQDENNDNIDFFSALQKAYGEK